MRLAYSAAPGCLDEESFRHAVAVLVEGGVDPFDDTAPDLLRVLLTRGPAGYRGAVQLVPAKEEPWPVEEMAGVTCSQVFRSAARVASLRAEPLPAPVPPAPGPPAPPSPDPPPSEASQAPSDPVASPPLRVAPAPHAQLRSAPPPTPRDPMDLTIVLHSAFVLTAGLTDNVGPALQIGAAARHDWETWGFSLGLEVRGVFPGGVLAREVIDLQPGAKPLAPQPFDVSQLAAQLVPCVHFAKYLAGCGVAQGFVMMQQTYDAFNVEPGWGLGPRIAFDLPLGERFGLFAFAEMLFPLQRTGQILIAKAEPERGGRLWDQSILSGFFGAGVSAKFE